MTSFSAKEIGEQLLAQLPSQLRQDVSFIVKQSDQKIRGAKGFVQENPREAFGFALGLGALAWTIIGTSPGRKLAQWGAMMAMPYVTTWIAERFDRGEVGDMGSNEEVVGQRRGHSIPTASAAEGSELGTAKHH